MFINFDKVFDESWKDEIITDKCPCKTCKESDYFINNPYYRSKECDNCSGYAVWALDCIRKLAWLESKEVRE